MKKERIVWIDIAKGIGILLVVLEHILMSYIRQTGNEQVIHALPIRIIVGFYMPLFFFLSGIFMKSILRKSFRDVFVNKFKRLMIPYLLWGCVSVVFYGIYSHSLPFLRILELPFRPIFVLWFVYTLFLGTLLFYILQTRFDKKNIIIFAIIMFILGRYLSQRYSIEIDSWQKPWVGLLQNFVFIYIGFLSKDIFYRFKKNRIYITALLSLIILVVLNVISNQNIFWVIPAEFFTSICGITFVCAISMLLADFEVLKRVFSYIGFMSMQIYLIHKIVVEVVSFVIIHFSSNVYIFSVINLSLTLLICYVAILFIDKLHWNKAFFGA